MTGQKNQESQTISQRAIGRSKSFFDSCCGTAELLRLKKIHAGRQQGNEDLKYVVNIKDIFNIFVHMS